MSERPQVVVLSSVEWGAAWQRHQIFARLWARCGHEVFFVENTGFRNPGWSDWPRLRRRARRLLTEGGASPASAFPTGMRIVNPAVLPPTTPLFRRLNASVLVPRLAQQLRGLGLRDGAVAVAYLPTATTLDILDWLAPSKVVYDCVDNFSGLPYAPRDLGELESELLRRSSLVVTSSRTLFEAKRPLHANVIELHQGVGPEFFLGAPRKSGYKKLCYYGTLWSAIDYEPIRALGEAGFEVTLIGPRKEPPPPLPPSVSIEPPLPYDALPSALRRFDALLLPYAASDYNRGVAPAKLFECLATGCPVLASPLPALESFADALYTARSDAEWVRLARELPRLETEERRRARVDLASSCTHDAVFARLRQAVSDSPPAPARGQAPAAGGAVEIAGAFAWIGVLFVLARAATLLTQIVAGRFLGPLEFGKANLVIAAAAYIQILPIMGFPVAMSRFVAVAKDDTERDRLIAMTLTVFAVWASVCLALILLLREPLSAAIGMAPPLFADAVGFAFLTALYVVIASPLLGLRRFDRRGVAEAIYGLSAPVTLATLVALGFSNYRALILTLCASLALGSAYSVWALRRRLRPSFSATGTKPIFEYAAVAALNLLSTACILAPARFLLHRYDSAFAVGVFSAYFTGTVQVALALVYIAGSVVVPLASDPQGQSSAWLAFRRWAPWAAAGAWATFSAACAAALAIFGRRYPFRLEWTMLFAAAASLILVHGLASALLAARDRRGLYVSAGGNLAAGAANIVLAPPLIARFGVAGAAVCLVLAYVAGLATYAVAAPGRGD